MERKQIGMNHYSIDVCHESYMDVHKPLLMYDENNNYEDWRSLVKKKLTEALGDMPQKDM